jgi:hypothetical protein
MRDEKKLPRKIMRNYTNLGNTRDRKWGSLISIPEDEIYVFKISRLYNFLF